MLATHRHTLPREQQREPEARDPAGEVRTRQLARGKVHEAAHRQCDGLTGEQPAGRAGNERERHRAAI
jgi:hypothetical protein